jgi:hypothetical protein
MGDGIIAHSLTVNGNGGDVTFNGSVGASGALLGALAVNTSGLTIFNAPVSVASLTTDTGGTTQINAGTIITTGVQSYGDNVSIKSNTVLNAAHIDFVSITEAQAQTNLNMTAQNAEVLSNITLTGNLQVITGSAGLSGGVSQNALTHLNIGGSTTLTADTSLNQVAALTSSANHFGGLLTLDQINGGSWANVSVTTQSALNLGALQSAGSVNLQAQGAITTSTLSASADVSVSSFGNPVSMGQTVSSGALNIQTQGGDVTQTGQFNVNGVTNINAQSADGSVVGNISLPNTNNTFTGSFSLVGNSTAIATASNLTLGTVQNSGSMSLTSAGSVSVGSAFITHGDLTLQSHDDLQLGSAQIGGSVNLTSTAGNISLGTSSINGNLSAQTNGGEIVQTGALQVTGSSTINAGSGQVVLSNVQNQLNGVVSVVASNAQISTAADLNLGASTLSGTLVAQSTAGNITQTAPLVVNGAASFVSPQGNVSLSNTANMFAQTLALNSQNATIAAAQSIDLAASTVQGQLSVTAQQGDITQQAPITVQGTSNLVAPAGLVNLNNPANQFAQPVSVATTGALTLDSASALTLGDMQVGASATINNQGSVNLGTGVFGGKLIVNSQGGAITQTGPIDFKSDTTFNAGSGAINLFDPHNLWTGAIYFTGGFIMINHPILIGGNNNAAALNRFTENVADFTASATPKVTLAAALQPSAASATPNGAANAPTIKSDSVISLSVDKAPNPMQPGLVTVTVSPEVSAGAKGFEFALDNKALPPQIGNQPNALNASQPDGQPLPNWLKFDPVTHSFSAQAVPPGAFPMRVKISAGGVNTVVLIQENQAVR